MDIINILTTDENMLYPDINSVKIRPSLPNEVVSFLVKNQEITSSILGACTTFSLFKDQVIEIMPTLCD